MSDALFNLEDFITKNTIEPSMLTPVLTAELMRDIIPILKAFDVHDDAVLWTISPRTHNQLRYWHHLSKLALPRRKLRKCQLRKVYQRQKQERKRYSL